MAPAVGVLTAGGTAQVSTGAVEATTALVVKFINGDAAAVPAAVTAQGAIAMMARTKLKVVLTVALAFAGLIGGGVVWQFAPAQPPARDTAPPAKAPEKPTDPPAKEKGAKVDKIKPGDWLKIEAVPVFDQAPLRDRYEVDSNGKVALPDIYGAPVKFDGLTLEEASAVVQKQMLIYLRECKVKITRTTKPEPTQEERIRTLEKEVKELRALVEELRNKKPQ